MSSIMERWCTRTYDAVRAEVWDEAWDNAVSLLLDPDEAGGVITVALGFGKQSLEHFF